MGYGDYCHWTAIIRDLYHEINSKKNNDEKVKLIEKLIDFKLKNKSKYGIINFKNKNSNSEFKFLLKKGKNIIINFTKQHEVFINNPYITSNENYSNIIILEIQSCGYGNKGKFDDKQHKRHKSFTIWLDSADSKPTSHKPTSQRATEPVKDKSTNRGRRQWAKPSHNQTLFSFLRLPCLPGLA